jgi:hypothetical protein
MTAAYESIAEINTILHFIINHFYFLKGDTEKELS